MFEGVHFDKFASEFDGHSWNLLTIDIEKHREKNLSLKACSIFFNELPTNSVKCANDPKIEEFYLREVAKWPAKGFA